MADDVGFSVGAVARRLGVAPSTLRTWNRRYGIGAQDLSPGRHRRYTAEDITRLEHMQRLILRGASPADAAQAALASAVAQLRAPVLDIPAMRSGPGHGAGGQRLALPGASPAARGLARAALAMDDGLMNEIIRTALARDGVVQAWQGLLVPVLSGIGTRYEQTGGCIEAEHLLSSVALAALAGLHPYAVGGAGDRPVLLACAAGDQHSLPLYALAAALAERGVSSRMLGAALPYDALLAAVRRIGPAAVFLWSQLRSTGDPAALPDLRPRRPGARLLLGGPGWPEHGLPDGSRLIGSLPGAVIEVMAALGRD
ncbi:MAG TPA: MerR family transcriptional regulator [Streptosporangiaceae bacterium]|nr:MerR family transcriptional regulator [Streptosporangiaceae bacterium]